MSSVITKIDRNSPLLHKVHVGDKLMSLNGKDIADVLDYKFYAYDSKVKVVVESPSGHRRTIKVKKHEGGDLGLDFETYLMDRPHACRNHCLFCFVDQLPRGMRKTLYFKDDDFRLSFLMGNYVTLTNISDEDIQRIIDLHISPINVSVHATDPDMRSKLLRNENGKLGYERLCRLAEGGITINCQIVCCPGLNDGDILQKSMEDMEKLYPQVNTCSIVPLGVTKFRKKLTNLTTFNIETARIAVDQINKFSDICFKKHGSHIFYPSDELYIKAHYSIPQDEYYEDYTQLENGVGLLRLLNVEFMSALNYNDTKPDGVPFSIATGVSAAPFIENLLVTAKENCDNIDGKVYAIVNDFFGHTIDVAGLITGSDLIAHLRGKELGKRLLIPINMLRDGEGVFLDDVTIEQVEKELSVEVVVVEQDGADLFYAMTGNFTEREKNYPKI